MLAFGVPLIPSAIAMWALQFVDRILLTKLASLGRWVSTRSPIGSRSACC